MKNIKGSLRKRKIFRIFYCPCWLLIRVFVHVVLMMPSDTSGLKCHFLNYGTKMSSKFLIIYSVFSNLYKNFLKKC
uniref:Uncharacterized protein n=1 Tax=Strigamia maritima TaxID=126957 RepID=T1JIX4_STRMM